MRFSILFLSLFFMFSNLSHAKNKNDSVRVSERAPASEERYTLNQICFRFSIDENACGKIPFCYVEKIPAGCQLAAHAPSYVKGLCDLQINNEQGCRIMEDQGSCKWTTVATQVCRAKTSSL